MYQAFNAPMIWTTHGNLPVSDLRYVPQWNVFQDRIEFIETYFIGDEVVKRNVHIKVLELPNGKHPGIYKQLQARVAVWYSRIRRNSGAGSNNQG